MVISASICLGEEAESEYSCLSHGQLWSLHPLQKEDPRWLSLARLGLGLCPPVLGAWLAGSGRGPDLTTRRSQRSKRVIHRAILLTASSASPDSKQLTSQAPGRDHLAAIRVTLTSFAMHSQAPRCSSAVEGQLLPAQRTPPSGPVGAEARVP